MRRRIEALSIVLVVTLGFSGCGTFANPANWFNRGSTDEIIAEAKAFAAGGEEYNAAGKRLAGLCQSGKLSADECVEITDDERAVRLEAKRVSALLKGWQAAGGRRMDKPGGYDDAKQALAAARQKVLTADLLAEVQ